jgi:pimeloyl-ACP methyl ester carboxylesterase
VAVACVGCGGIELEYETTGDPANPAMVLVMGYTAQLTAWGDGFCRLLADEGFHVVRFDNRDCGLSTHLEGTPDIGAILTGDHASAVYSLDHMADDVAGLLDALGIGAAHVVGVSMGGMIAQLVAIRHPQRTLSLCSIMSTTGAPGVGKMSPEGLAVMLVDPPANRDGAAENAVAQSRVSTPNHLDEDRMRREAAAAYDRAHDPTGAGAGAGRQLAAIAVSGDRTEALAGVTAPTLVIHGSIDPLIAPSGGAATAAAVPGADLWIIDGLGHYLPEQLWPDITRAIAKNARTP